MGDTIANTHVGTVEVIENGVPVDRKVRRLTVHDIFWLVRLLADPIRRVSQEAGGLNLGPEQLGYFIFMELPDSEEAVTEFLASLVGMEAGELSKQPATVLPEIIEVLANSEDVDSFFDKFKRIAATQLAKDQTKPSPKPSTESSSATAGATSRS